MKISESKPLTDDQLDKRDWRNVYELEIETSKGRISFSFADGEPEDASLSRDFSGVFNIKKAIELAYEAGKSGEEIKYEEFETDI